jgi:hypothetical protein
MHVTNQHEVHVHFPKYTVCHQQREETECISVLIILACIVQLEMQDKRECSWHNKFALGGGGAKSCTHFLLPKVPQKVAKHECLEIFGSTQIWEHLLDLEESLLLNPQYGLSPRDTNLNHSVHTGYHHAHVLSYQSLRLEAS